MPTALVAMANFKGTLSNVEATSIAAHALWDLGYTPIQLPIGDGGTGTAQCVFSKLGGQFESVGISQILSFPNPQHPDWIYIESTETCGKNVVMKNGESALTASSYRLGDLLNQVFKKSVLPPQMYVGLGDSGISDAGVGMLSKLGFRFFDDKGTELSPLIAEMRRLATLEPPLNRPWEKISLTILCDVNNPLCGPQGSAAVFSPQKGATTEQVQVIAAGMEQLAAVYERTFGKTVSTKPFCGSVGGLASALYACLGATLVSGAEHLFKWIEVDSLLAEADLIVTGEGQTDGQSFSGKAPFSLLQRASEKDLPTYFFSGGLGAGYEKLLEKENLKGIYATGKDPDAKTALFQKIKSVLCG